MKIDIDEDVCHYCDKPATHYEYCLPDYYVDHGYGVEFYYCAECVASRNITTAEPIDDE